MDSDKCSIACASDTAAADVVCHSVCIDVALRLYVKVKGLAPSDLNKHKKRIRMQQQQPIQGKPIKLELGKPGRRSHLSLTTTNKLITRA